MVRAGVVSHLHEWRWCGYDELAGRRQRNRLVNEDRWLKSMGIGTRQKFRDLYIEAIERRLAEGRLAREPHWTESLAVGSFITGDVSAKYTQRRTLDVGEVSDLAIEIWALKESQEAYKENMGLADGMLATETTDDLFQKLYSGRVVVDVKSPSQLQSFPITGQSGVLRFGIVDGDAQDLLRRAGLVEEFFDCEILALEYAGHGTTSSMVI